MNKNIKDVPIIKIQKNCKHEYKPCKHPAIFDFDICTKCKKIK